VSSFHRRPALHAGETRSVFRLPSWFSLLLCLSVCTCVWLAPIKKEDRPTHKRLYFESRVTFWYSSLNQLRNSSWHLIRAQLKKSF
jgi:hypothetical protein